MGRFFLAVKFFFKILFNGEFAARCRGLLEGAGRTAPAPEKLPPAPQKPAPAAPARSDAVTLLAVLQREARLIDFLKEPITAYSDAQIGAAVRDVHRDAGAALERLFALRAVLESPEGSEVPIPAGFDAARIRLVGNLGGQTPPRGKLQHSGWQATRIELPQFSGAAESANVIAPAEVEV